MNSSPLILASNTVPSGWVIGITPFLADLDKAGKERSKVRNMSRTLGFMCFYGKNQYLCKRIAYLDIFYETDKIICAFFIGNIYCYVKSEGTGEHCQENQ